MSDYPKTFIVQNDTVTVSEELHQTLNLLADRNYQLMGYVSQPNQDYSKANHPQELMCYQMALEAAYIQQQTGGLDE